MNPKPFIHSLASRSGLFAVLLLAAGMQLEAQSLRVGYQQGGSATLPLLALEENLYEKTGVAPRFVQFSNSADGLNALNSGKLDIGVSFGTGAPLTFATKGAKFVIIGGNLSGGHPIVTNKENATHIKSIEDFRGKVIGTPRLFTSDVVFRGALFTAGIDPEKDVRIIEFKRPLDVLEAVKSGKVDIGIGSSNIYGRALQSGLAIPLWSNDLFPDHPCCRIVATEEAIATKRPELVNFLKAELLAEKLFSENPQAGVKAIVNQLRFSEELARDLVLEPHQQLSVDPNTNGVGQMWNYMNHIQYLQSDLDYRNLIDTSLYREALDQLRQESPDPFWEKLDQRYRLWNN